MHTSPESVFNQTTYISDDLAHLYYLATTLHAFSKQNQKPKSSMLCRKDIILIQFMHVGTHKQDIKTGHQNFVTVTEANDISNSYRQRV